MTMKAKLFSEKCLDSSGAGISGAKLYVYKEGTSTLCPIFNRLDIALSNPLTSDVDGEFTPFCAGDAGNIKMKMENRL